MPPIPANRCETCTGLLVDIWLVDGVRVCERCVGPAEARGGHPVPVAIACHLAPAERERLDVARRRAHDLAVVQAAKRLN